jgi:hypothetical protein
MAKKIIKEGIVPKYMGKCPLCGTEFTFEHQDIKSKTEMRIAENPNINIISSCDPFVKIDFVTCPKCYTPIKMDNPGIKRVYDQIEGETKENI